MVEAKSKIKTRHFLFFSSSSSFVSRGPPGQARLIRHLYSKFEVFSFHTNDSKLPKFLLPSLHSRWPNIFLFERETTNLQRNDYANELNIQMITWTKWFIETWRPFRCTDTAITISSCRLVTYQLLLTVNSSAMREKNPLVKSNYTSVK